VGKARGNHRARMCQATRKRGEARQEFDRTDGQRGGGSKIAAKTNGVPTRSGRHSKILFMNLYECEGKKLFEKHGIKIPAGVCIHREEDAKEKYALLRSMLNNKLRNKKIDENFDVVAKAQILSGKRGKAGGIKFCSSAKEVNQAVVSMFGSQIKGMHVETVRIEEKLDIAEEHYMSITYDTNKKVPVLIYSSQGGVDIEDVPAERIMKYELGIRNEKIEIETEIPYAQELWNCFLQEDARLVEINPLVKTKAGEWMAADAKVAIDDDAFFRHKEEWSQLEPRTEMGRFPTDREIEIKKIDAGEDYYRGTAGKYIEMDGDIAILFSGGGASIANMDVLIKTGLKPANYTEYSGNPPREKVYELTKIVLSKPRLRGLWIAGGVANFTNVKETFHGIVDALDEVKPNYPIVVRRAGPFEVEGMELMLECGERNDLNMKLFGKETSMSETAMVLAKMVIGN
jgi:citryl-CoA synthetase large subunit